MTSNEGVIVEFKKSVCKYGVNSCTGTFVAAKTLPQYLSFREDFANGGVPVFVFHGPIVVEL